MNRRKLIKGIGAAICAGMVPDFIPRIITDQYIVGPVISIPFPDTSLFVPGDRVILPDNDWGFGSREVIAVDRERSIVTLG